MQQNPRVWFTPLHLAECSHAIAKQVFYRKFSQAAADAIFKLLQRDRADGHGLRLLCRKMRLTFVPTLATATDRN